jgi:hypothetical protein
MKIRKRNSHHRPAPREPQEPVRSAVSALRGPMAFYVLRRII